MAEIPTAAGATIPLAAPLNSDSSGQTGAIAAQSVFRIICQSTNSAGTGFLHMSGKVLTAEHVIRGCLNPIALLSNTTQIPLKVIATDQDKDIALLELATPLAAPAFPISDLSNFTIGTQVVTWGYPNGYNAYPPMLSVGYLSGSQGVKADSGDIVGRFVVNAAFNSGNSGGPLIHVETGKVIGIVSSKLAPVSEETLSALKALQSQQSGFAYTAKRPDGSTFNVSEGQVIAGVLDDLRKQIQLVIGMATPIDDIKAFLNANKIIP